MTAAPAEQAASPERERTPPASNPIPKAPPVNEFLARTAAQRREHLGSRHTTFDELPPPLMDVPPLTPSPGGDGGGDSGDAYSDSMPDLVPADDAVPRPRATSGWDDDGINAWTSTGHDWSVEPRSGGGGGGGGGDTAWREHYYSPKDPLQDAWWDPDVRRQFHRPGPGLLPVAAWNEVHDTDHALASVVVTPPTAEDIAAGDVGTKSAKPSTTVAPPSADDVRTAVPHPNAYYCRAENGWVLLELKKSNVLPNMPHTAPGSRIPSTMRGTRTVAPCSGLEPHHFHIYREAGNGTSLTTRYVQRDWEPKHSDRMNVFVCCRCETHAVVSSMAIPGVIPSRWMNDFMNERASFPGLNRTPEDSILLGLQAISTILENYLWLGSEQSIRSSSNYMSNRIGWTPCTIAIWEALHFTQKPVEAEENQPAHNLLVPPPHEPDNCARLLRAWVEIQAWMADFRRRTPRSKITSSQRSKVYVKTENATQMLQEAFGAYPDQIERKDAPEGVELDMLHGLGLTANTWHPELIKHAYKCQIHCDPAHIPQHFTRLVRLSDLALSSDLQTLVATERSLNRWTLDDLNDAVKVFGFGENNELGIDAEWVSQFWQPGDPPFVGDKDEDDRFIEQAYHHQRQKPASSASTWLGLDIGPVSQTPSGATLKTSLRILAQFRGSKRLMKLAEAPEPMSLDKAYDLLGIPHDLDDATICTVFAVRINDSPTQAEQLHEAFKVISDSRNSLRLSTYVKTGLDPGDIVAQRPPTWPRGLNQLGNTCYLNSLLQYFYTIKDLREAIAPEATAHIDKVSDDDLKKHRVGGRLVTRKEVARSKKFVSHLANLFVDLQTQEGPAVTPALELAKLALVTSKDEEEDERAASPVIATTGRRPGTNSSTSTDATLVDQDLEDEIQLTAMRNSSVLGKRPRRTKSAMDLDEDFSRDENIKDGFVVVPRAGSEGAAAASQAMDTSDDSVPSVATVRAQGPPPLPPRKKSTLDDAGTMMFGRQHDVSECMDNCMFQIETALLKFDGNDDAQKASVVKRLFYGKLRQRVTALEGGKVNEKEDLFMSLPVNVVDEGFDLYDGLAGYFDDIVEFEGKKSRMEVTLVDLPPVLHIQLQRVQFNRETLQPYKCHAYVKFGEVLYMDRFLDSAAQDLRERSKAIHTELTACRERLRTLTQGKHAPYTDALQHSLRFLQAQEAIQLDEEVDDELIAILNSEQALLEAELKTLRDRAAALAAERETLWASAPKSPQAEYELTSVFVHRGAGPSWGHYFFYARNLPDKPDEWFKYNDSDVTVVSKDEVLRDTTGDTANAYMLVYARKGSDVMHTIHRATFTDDEAMNSSIPS